MKRSESRILTTHTGSLPRTPGTGGNARRSVAQDESVDETALDAARSRDATAAVVASQMAAGVDVINNGEQSRISFSTYVTQRMSGFGGTWTRRGHRDQNEFPSIARPRVVQLMRDVPTCTGPLNYERLDMVEHECRQFLDVVNAADSQPEELFMTAASPGIVALTLGNRYYDSHEDYVFALGRGTAQGVRNHRISRPNAATRLPRPGHGTPRFLPGRASGSLSGRGGPAHPRHQPRPDQHPSARACGCTSAGATAKGRTTTTCRSRTYVAHHLRAPTSGRW